MPTVTVNQASGSPSSSTYQLYLAPGEDVTVLAASGKTLTHTKLTNGRTRIRIKASE